MFDKLGLHDDFVRALHRLGFTTPTPIQERAIPPALAGRDLLASAPTGTGKTAAFVLPILQRLRGTHSRATRALILTPTRELASQVDEQLVRFASGTSVRTTCVVGGVAMGPQTRALRAGIDVLVATPGRLLDHLQYPYARLDAVEVLVLDEADRMLDMGFLPAIRRVLERLPRKRQTLLFSATLPPPIVALSRSLLADPVSIAIERAPETAGACRQAVFPVAPDRKTDLLVELFERNEIASAIVFTRTKHRANRLARVLDRRGVPCAPIHGDRSQAQRTQALSGFRSGRFPVLVATDIAARGIDVENLSHVVNFDVPQSPEDYVHRVGRTARAQASGDALTFVSPDEEAGLRSIEKMLGSRIARRRLDGFDHGASDVSVAVARSAPTRSPRASSHASRARTQGRPAHRGSAR
jgi:ATP-dependent RNA helicase RhlE